MCECSCFSQRFVDVAPSSSSAVVGEAVTLSGLLATGSGFVLEALENRSLILAISLLTQMVQLYTYYSVAV